MAKQQLVRAVLGGLAAATILGAVSTIGLSIGFAHGARAGAVDSLFPNGPADGRVVIVAADRSFMRRARIDPVATYSNLVSEIAEAEPDTVVVQRDLVTTAAAQLATLRPAEGLVVEAAFERVGVALFPAAAGELEDPRSGSRLPTQTRPILAEEGVTASAGTGVDTVTAGSPQAVVRTVPLAVEIVGSDEERPGTVVPSLALLAASRADGLRPEVQERSHGLEIDGRFIPTEGDQELRVRYVDDLLPGGDQVVSADQLIGGRIPRDQLRGHTLVLGVTDSSTVAPLPAPAGPGRLAPVFVQANALSTLLTGDYLVPDSSVATIAAVAGLALAVVVTVLLVPMWLTPLPAGIAGIAWWLFAAQRFAAGHVTDIVYPLAALVLALLGAGGWRGWSEFRARRRVSALFSRYVPDAVVEELLEEGKAEAAAAGRRLEVAVMFCDLRGFTRMSEQLEPTQVREILEVYFEEASRIILDHDGTVLQFVGDEVLAVFGAPLPQADYAAAALACARDMLDVKPALNSELADRDLPPVEYGIGVHAGDIVAAHIGSSAHRQYGIVGDTANVGSRLCNQARAGEIVVSEETLRAAGDDGNADRIGPLELKGIERQIVGYRIRATWAPAN
ncbi:MAG: adenylate/guanylate cyclase domain-containing protein [Actinobacteria bacterium]|nr:adenylate/guanylate cyclase domain-containing protein [Actinomycetota bacterium]